MNLRNKVHLNFQKNTYLQFIVKFFQPGVFSREGLDIIMNVNILTKQKRLKHESLLQQRKRKSGLQFLKRRRWFWQISDKKIMRCKKVNQQREWTKHSSTRDATTKWRDFRARIQLGQVRSAELYNPIEFSHVTSYSPVFILDHG